MLTWHDDTRCAIQRANTTFDSIGKAIEEQCSAEPTKSPIPDPIDTRGEVNGDHQTYCRQTRIGKSFPQCSGIYRW
jgi:hypothetical protein